MTEEKAPQRLLRPLGAVAIIVGIVIGAGIFKTPSMVASVTGDIGWLVLMWCAGAVISLAGALCYAELSTAYPHAGGDYHFLSRAYGKNVSFGCDHCWHRHRCRHFQNPINGGLSHW